MCISFLKHFLWGHKTSLSVKQNLVITEHRRFLEHMMSSVTAEDSIKHGVCSNTRRLSS